MNTIRSCVSLIVVAVIGATIAVAGTVGAATIDGVPTVFPPLTAPSYTATAASGSMVFQSSSGGRWQINNPTDGEYVWLEAAPDGNQVRMIGSAGSAQLDVTADSALSAGVELTAVTGSAGGIEIFGTVAAQFYAFQINSLGEFSSPNGFPAQYTFQRPVILGTTGTAISASFRATLTADVASIAANTCSDTAITVTGAVAGSDCVPAPPSALTAGLSATCYVSSLNTVQFRLCNVTTGAIDPAAGLVYGARVFNP